MNRDGTGRLRHPAGAPKSIGGQYAPDNNRSGAAAPTMTTRPLIADNQARLERAASVSNRLFGSAIADRHAHNVRTLAREQGIDISEVRSEPEEFDNGHFQVPKAYDRNGRLVFIGSMDDPVNAELADELDALVNNAPVSDDGTVTYTFGAKTTAVDEVHDEARREFSDIQTVMAELYDRQEAACLRKAAAAMKLAGEERDLSMHVNHESADGRSFRIIDNDTEEEVYYEDLDGTLPDDILDLARSHPENDGATYLLKTGEVV